MIKSRNGLKAKVVNISKKSNIPNQYLIQKFLFESLIKRISISKYKNNFIIKGGFLLASIFGIDLRSTMDLDTTIKGLPLNKKDIFSIMNEIINIDINDNVVFKIESVREIREEEQYSGYRINLNASFDGIKSNLMIDITAGDIITYKEMNFKYKTLFDNKDIDIMAYNNETIIAEKYESILSRNIENTRMKDYYDLYMFVKTKWSNIDLPLLKIAIQNTANNRKTTNYVNNAKEYIYLIENDERLQKLWKIYCHNYTYAQNVSFNDTISAINYIYNAINEGNDK